MESARDKLKPKTPFTRKVHKSEIEALLLQSLAFEEDVVAKDDTTPKEPTDQDDSILVNSTIAKNSNQVEIRGFLSAFFKNTSNSKTKVNKASIYGK